MPTAPRKRSLWDLLSARLERSQHVFLLGLVVAFAVEILVDWNATFYEINVLRTQLGEKARHYATILRLAASEPLAAADRGKLLALARRVLEDDEVAYVRFTDGAGQPLVEAGEPLGPRYPRQLARDVQGMLQDPEALRRRIAGSRHRDLFQAITDGEDALLRKLLPAGAMDPPPPTGSAAMLAFQDRLYEEQSGERREDRSVVWCLALVEQAAAHPGGVLLVALRTDALRQGIRKKLLKGLAITLFFLGVIAAQQLSSRRAKLRLLSLRDALAAAREAVAAGLPATVPAVAGLVGGVAFKQAERLGGTIYDFDVASPASGAVDVFIGLPEGSGVDVAFASIYLRDAHRKLRQTMGAAAPDELLWALVRAYGEAPIHRRVELCLMRVDGRGGEAVGVIAGMEPPVVVTATGEALPVALQEWSTEGVEAGPGMRFFSPPLRHFRVALPPGATLAVVDDGLRLEAQHPLSRVELQRRLGELGREDPATVAARLLGRIERRGGAVEDDLLALVLRRAEE